jgi:hypothetical protein
MFPIRSIQCNTESQPVKTLTVHTGPVIEMEPLLFSRHLESVSNPRYSPWP